LHTHIETMRPRLVYFGDIPVSASSLGSAQVFRLLEEWPAGELLVLELHARTAPEDRLPNAAYRRVEIGLPTHRRMGALRHLLEVGRVADALAASLGDFRPDAVLTVAHSVEWLAAHRLARRLGVPLHLLVHDDGMCRRLSGRAALAWLNELAFGHVYRAAATRLCISPYMEAEYRARYGAAGTVLLPTAGHGIPDLSGAPSHGAGAGLRIAFGGTVGDLADDLATLGRLLAARGGKLLFYGAAGENRIAAAQLAERIGPVMEVMPFFASEADYLRHLRANADAAFLPMSYSRAQAEKMRLCFPSKITAYTLAGLPVIVRGPDYCSAVRWARETEPFAIVLDDPGEAALARALDDLAADAALRERLAAASLAAGERHFRAEVAQATFLAAITGRDSIPRRAQPSWT
jgi:glycosyltransferase involved in cell wall biosynthesis